MPRLEKNSETGHLAEMNSRQYLELMGIDVWRRRPPRSARPDPAAAVVLEPEEQIAPAVSGASNIESFRQSLGRVTEKTAPPERVEAPLAAPVPIVAGGPSFLLVFANFPGVTFAAIYSADLARLPDNHQRFLAGLYFALTGNKATAENTDFRWPMVKSKHISQSQEEAKQVLEQSLDRLADQVLVFGQSAADLLPHAAVAAYETTLLTGKAAGKTLWVVPELDHYFSQPIERKKLWQWLGGLREALIGAAR